MPTNCGTREHPSQPAIALGTLWAADPAARSTSNKSGASGPSDVLSGSSWAWGLIWQIG
jgi:hypothetical protein